jgi:RNA-binding protein
MSEPLEDRGEKGLRGHQRKFLRGLAHGLSPVVQVGHDGVSPAVLQAVDRALLDHELIKVRMIRPPDKKAMARALAEGTAAHLCGLVGHVAILYRPHPESPTIDPPSADDAGED